jgi:hypothetical protein
MNIIKFAIALAILSLGLTWAISMVSLPSATGIDRANVRIDRVLSE